MVNRAIQKGLPCDVVETFADDCTVGKEISITLACEARRVKAERQA